VNLSLLRQHLLNLWTYLSQNPFQDLRTLSVLAGGEYSHLRFVFYKCSHRLCAYLTELQPRTPAAGMRNGRCQLVGAYVLSIQGRSVSTVEQANLAFTAAFDDTAAGDPIEFGFSLDLMLSTFAVHLCIFSCSDSNVSTLLAPFRGRRILRLYWLPSLRSRTRTLTPICSNGLSDSLERTG
jgi:hypothetical protein